jgi:hypothetical protein
MAAPPGGEFPSAANGTTHYDVFTSRVYTERLILFEGERSHMHFFVRELSYHELAAWLRQGGLSVSVATMGTANRSLCTANG